MEKSCENCRNFYPCDNEAHYKSCLPEMKDYEPKVFTIEFSTVYEIEADNQEEALEKAYKQFEIDLECYGTELFNRYDENGKGI